MSCLALFVVAISARNRVLGPGSGQPRRLRTLLGEEAFVAAAAAAASCWCLFVLLPLLLLLLPQLPLLLLYRDHHEVPLPPPLVNNERVTGMPDFLCGVSWSPCVNAPSQ